MKICLINNLYKPFARGGAERIVELTAQGLKGAGHEVFVIATSPKKNHLNFEDGIKTYFIPSVYYNLNKIPKIARLFWHIYDVFDIVNYVRVARILKNEKVDIVITHNLKGITYLLPFLLEKLGIKHVHVLHDMQLIHPSGLKYYGRESEVNGVFSSVYSYICSLLFNSPDFVVSPSKWLMDDHVRKGFFRKSEKKIISNPVFLKEIADNNKSKSDGMLNFLYIGQIEKHKGVFLLLDAFKEVLRLDLNARLTVVGTGSRDMFLIKCIGNEKRIKFLGKKNTDEIMVLMKNSDCLVVPSLCYENSPTVIYEAALSDLFILASNLGGIPELIKNFKGDTFKPEKEYLVEKLINIIKNPDITRIIPGEFKNSIEKFSLGQYVRSLNDLF